MLVINDQLKSIIQFMETTAHIPEDMIQDLEKIIYKKPRFSQPGHSSTTMLRGGGALTYIESKRG